MRLAGVMAVAQLLLLFGCAPTQPRSTRAPDPRLEAVVFPAVIVPGTRIIARGHSLTWTGSTPRLEVVTNGGTAMLDAVGEVEDDEGTFAITRSALDRLGVGQMLATMRVVGGAGMSNAVDTEIISSGSVPLDLVNISSGTSHWNDSIPVAATGLLFPGEGQVVALFRGRFRSDRTGDVRDVDVDLPVTSTDFAARRSGLVMLRPSLGAGDTGVFEGDIALRSRSIDGTQQETTRRSIVLDVEPPFVRSVEPGQVSVGQFVRVNGAGFFGSREDGGTTTLQLVGTFIDDETSGTRPIDAPIVAAFVSGTTIQFPIEYDIHPQENLLRSFLFGIRPGRFSGTIRARTLYDLQMYETNEIPVSFQYRRPVQVVFLKFLGGFYDTLEMIGLGAAASRITALVLERARRIYQGHRLEFRDTRPTDFADGSFATVEVGGEDPTGEGRGGLENQPRDGLFDTGNVVLGEIVGGDNVGTRSRYGGVFVQSFLYFSAHPGISRPRGTFTPDPLFDEIFDPVRQNPVTPDEVNGIGSADRMSQVDRAILAFAAMAGETSSHELGHSLGMPHPMEASEGSLMDTGSFRPVGERAEQPGYAPSTFGPYTQYMREVLGSP